MRINFFRPPQYFASLLRKIGHNVNFTVAFSVVFSFVFMLFQNFNMKNNTSFCDNIEQLIVSENLAEAGKLMLSFLVDFNKKTPSNLSKEMQKQTFGHVYRLNDLSNQVTQKRLTEGEAATIEKEIWIAFHKINGQIRDLQAANDAALTDNAAAAYVSTHVPKPETWHHAGWLPLLIAGGIVGVLFTIGMSYSGRLQREKKAAEQAVIDRQNGVVRPTLAEGEIALKLMEIKTVKTADEAVAVTIKSVKGTNSSLEIGVNCENTLKENLKNANFLLIDIEQNGKEIQAVERVGELGHILSVLNQEYVSSQAKTIHFNHSVGKGRRFLLHCTFTTDKTNVEKSVAVPFQLR